MTPAITTTAYRHRSPLRSPTDGGLGWRKVGEVATGYRMMTNLGCTFTSRKTALLTYLDVKDADVTDRGYTVHPRSSWGAAGAHVGLTCDIIDLDWFAAQASATLPGSHQPSQDRN